MASLNALLLLCLVLLSVVRAGTWLSFNDYKESPMDFPIRSNIDIVDVCNEQQRRLQKRAEHRILTRAERENSDMCRFLLRMGRSI
ncbi:hypothetical protein Y032_0022g457 [Ancylostoma ceylanicum]|uniref:Corticotropin-releasing factor domain-containing protein n=2 Tax=Ancylostoma TaxID=29169 RepID=A0A016UYP1_9BILA|nr:hypothetical protein Y032_0022g457 [Ancylostoma ceylanicum]